MYKTKRKRNDGLLRNKHRSSNLPCLNMSVIRAEEETRHWWVYSYSLGRKDIQVCTFQPRLGGGGGEGRYPILQQRLGKTNSSKSCRLASSQPVLTSLQLLSINNLPGHISSKKRSVFRWYIHMYPELKKWLEEATKHLQNYRKSPNVCNWLLLDQPLSTFPTQRNPWNNSLVSGNPCYKLLYVQLTIH